MNKFSGHKLDIFKRKFNNAKHRKKSYQKNLFYILFKKLALAGFELHGNYVVCIFCNLRYYNFLDGRNPELFHIKNSRNCPFILQKYNKEFIGNTILADTSDSKLFICKICRVKKISSYFSPCFHAMSCDLCFRNLENKCPYCLLKINALHKIYYS